MATTIHAISEDLLPMATSSPWRAKWTARLFARVDNPKIPISADIWVCMNNHEKSGKGVIPKKGLKWTELRRESRLFGGFVCSRGVVFQEEFSKWVRRRRGSSWRVCNSHSLNHTSLCVPPSYIRLCLFKYILLACSQWVFIVVAISKIKVRMTGNSEMQCNGRQ